MFPGGTPLSSAALFGEVAVARYLLDNGADPNKIEERGSVALHNAAKSGLSLSLSRHMLIDLFVVFINVVVLLTRTSGFKIVTIKPTNYDFLYQKLLQVICSEKIVLEGTS